MSTEDKNKGLFDKFKKSVDLAPADAIEQRSEPSIHDSAAEAKQLIEQELLRRLSAEKHRLAAELEIKFKEASTKRVQDQEQKFKQLVAQEKRKYQQLLEQEKQKYEKILKEKYNRVMKNMLHEREQKISEKYKRDYYATDVELRQQIEKLKQELTLQQQNVELQVNQATINAKKEQEQASRALFDNLLQSSRNEIVQQTEANLQAAFSRKEAELKRKHAINLKKHTAKLLNTYKEKLRKALHAQEQAIAQANNEKLSVQGELLNHRVQQKVQAAVAAATSKLELEFVREKQELNTIIENLRPEVEVNRLRMRVELEKEIRAEFEEKFAQYKQKIEAIKQAEVETILTTEKQKLAEAMQEENLVVLRYKEREIRESCSEQAQQVQMQIQSQLQEQESRLRAEHARELEQLAIKLKADYAVQLQSEAIQERARISDQATNEKKILLQQQQAELQKKFDEELTQKLSAQAQSFKQQYETQISDLEARLLELQKKHHYKTADIQPPYDPFAIDQDTPAPQTQSHAITSAAAEAEKQAALQAQERGLRAEFAAQLQAARAKWEQEQGGTVVRSNKQELIDYERRLRKEFQAILDQQRLQTAAKFAKQRDVEVQEALARYKQKMLEELEVARANDLAVMQEAIKQQLAVKAQQQSELARVEVEKTKEQLLAEQAQKLQHSLDLQLEVINKEQERKFALYAQQQDEKMHKLLDEEKHKLQVKFAQDKANLIKELTAKFTREKHAAMSKYETELREKLHKEMVKQKSFIQNKFTQAQEAALQDQKRRLESQHKHEIERIKKGYFDHMPGASLHDHVIVERNVEHLADRILSKFQKDS